MKTSNAKARTMVQNTWEFTGSNTYGLWIGKEATTGYVVYSYARHWPLFIKFHGVWYENSDRYSVTTSKHRSQLHPLVDTVKKTATEMKELRDKIKAGNPAAFAEVA